MTLRLLVFGRTGQVATELGRLAGKGLAFELLDRAEADLAVPASCATRIAEADCDAVINAAAYTAVDRAESEEPLATVINGEAPGAMAAAAAGRGLPFLHVSTDYVFDGRADRPWREDDPVGPPGAYGRSKLAGERAVLAAGGRAVILRTSWVFAAHGQNFLRTMLRVGAERPRLTVVDDQRGGPTAAGDIARALVTIARACATGHGVPGIFHYCGRPATTWHGFAREIFDRAGLHRSPELVPITTAEWPTAAARPANSVLDCAKIAGAYGIEQPDWRASLDHALAEIGERTA